MPRTLSPPVHVPIVDDAPMRFDEVADNYISARRATGHINSDDTERSYRLAFNALREDVNNRDPRKIGPADIERTLSRWPGAATRGQRQSALNSLFQWMVWQRIRDTNPVDPVERPKIPKPEVKRINLQEIRALIRTSTARDKERWAIALFALTGARCSEVCHLRKRDVMRDGWVRLNGKGSKVRWVPVPDELAPVIEEIRERVPEFDDYVIPYSRVRDGRKTNADREYRDDHRRPMTRQGMFVLVRRVGRNAGLPLDISPHVLRRFYAESTLVYAGQLATQTAMGHASFDTTAHYAGGMTMDHLQDAMSGWQIGYRALSPERQADSPRAT